MYESQFCSTRHNFIHPSHMRNRSGSLVLPSWQWHYRRRNGCSNLYIIWPSVVSGRSLHTWPGLALMQASGRRARKSLWSSQYHETTGTFQDRMPERLCCDSCQLWYSTVYLYPQDFDFNKELFHRMKFKSQNFPICPHTTVFRCGLPYRRSWITMGYEHATGRTKCIFKSSALPVNFKSKTHDTLATISSSYTKTLSSSPQSPGSLRMLLGPEVWSLSVGWPG